MAHYVKCPSCNGYGYFSCNDCQCKRCKSKGKINCSNCTGGYIPCEFCDSTGQIAKKLLFFTNYEPCPECNGAKKLTCPVCKGSDLVICPECKGTGRVPSCATCGGSGKIECSKCAGTGKIESAWYKSLNNLPVERLRFEYEKRQREIQQLQIKISRRSRELDDMYEEYERDRNANPYLYDHPGAYPGGLDSIPREISQLEENIGKLEDEMEAIDEVLNTKWK